MNDERRRLLLARETWRSNQPTEMDVLQAAKRIATNFQPRKVLSFGRPARMVSGALATIAGLAYAGSGNWADLSGRIFHSASLRPTTEEIAAQGAAQQGPRLPHEPKEERAGVTPERLAPDAAASAVDPTSKPTKKKIARTAPRVRRIAPSAGGGTTATSPATSAESAEGNGTSADRLAATSADRLAATWADINAALGTLDYARAETLLLQLADKWHDADTRAKAHLGLAQLAAARGDCERARVLALGVAAAPGIEMKTVRRALELAVRCAR